MFEQYIFNLFERITEREKEKHREERRGREKFIFYPLIHSSNVSNGLEKARLKLAYRNSFQVSHVNGRAPDTGSSSAAFSAALASNWTGSGASRTGIGAHMECQLCTHHPKRK